MSLWQEYMRSRQGEVYKKSVPFRGEWRQLEGICTDSDILISSYSYANMSFPNLTELSPRKSNNIEHIDFTLELLANYLQQLKLGRTPGPDGLTVKFPKRSASTIASPSTQVIPASIAIEKLPSAWKTVQSELSKKWTGNEY
ncbi:hypothetical protein HHI36_007393 [Cryptolaemus montrouzieri]|uniref:Uncharacterized protein n=1 Tax=Cryptolaemus montrouzieri TaxID=559131 RepID=A0ABD2MPE4_9CUCU